MPSRNKLTNGPCREKRASGGQRVGRVLATSLMVSLAIGGSLAGVAEAAPATGRMIAPQDAKSIAAGYVDALGDLKDQCGMSELASVLRGSTPLTEVASEAVKASLAAAEANKSCGAAEQVGHAVSDITDLADKDKPVYIGQEMSSSRSWGGLGPEKCKVVIHVGESESQAHTYTANFTC
jgi:hypothetical protein